MAYTIQYTPPAYSSIHGDLIYTVAFPERVADPGTYPNFKFIGDVYVDGVLVARLKKIQDPITGIGIFNVGQIVRNYVAMIFDPAPSVLVTQRIGNGEFSVKVVMKFGEEYTGTTTYDALTDSERIFFNNYNGRLIGSTSSLTAFANKVASNRPATGYTMLNNAFNFVPYFPTSTSSVAYSVTPAGGGSVHAGTFTPDNAYEMTVLNLSPVALNAVSAGTINAATTRYTVVIGSETFVFKIICEAIHDPYTIHFLNQYGGFDSHIFSKVSRKTIDLDRKSFGKLPYTVDSSGQVTYKSANNVYNESRSEYSVQYEEKLQLNSDLLTDLEYEWLQDLLLSPMVYVEDSGYFFPAVITQNNYEPKKVVNDELTNLTISIEYGQRLNSQFR